MTPAPAKRKSQSSPQSRDAEATRARILDAAEEEFARNGLGAARTEAIAAQTGVTKAMIYYYFESKERLYEAVLERAFNDRIRAIQSISAENLGPTQALTRFIEEFISGAAGNPNWPAILMFEAMQNKGKYYSKIGITSVYGMLSAILTRGMEGGEFRKLDPLHASVNIVGMCSFYFCAHENLKHLWPGRRMLGQAMIDEHKREAIALIMAGVRPLAH